MSAGLGAGGGRTLAVTVGRADGAGLGVTTTMIGFSALVEAGRGVAGAAASGDGVAPAAATLGAAVGCGVAVAAGDGDSEGSALGDGDGFGDGFGDGVAEGDGNGDGEGGAVGTSVTTGCGPVICATGVTCGAEVAPSSGNVPRF